MVDDITAEFLLKDTERDIWLAALTKDILGSQHSELYRVLFFKEEVAALNKASHSLWLTAERTSQADLEWIFGFNLPQSAPPHAERVNPTPIPNVKPQEEHWERKEEDRLKAARELLAKIGEAKDEDPIKQKVKEVEAWNLADSEAWRFARAFSARRRVEREVWEEEEKKYSGSEQRAGVKGGAKWWGKR